MLLLNKFRKVFKEQIASIGLSLTVEKEDELIAENHEKHLYLKTYLLNFGGSGQLAIGELQIIKGNIQKALEDQPFEQKDSLPVQRTIGNFTLHTEQEVAKQSINLVALQSLETYIFKCDEYLIIKQKGNHDLIRKNPIFIDFLRGKMTIDDLFTKIASLNIPNGLYVQKPIGFGDPEKVKKWKKIGTIVTILTAITLILVRILKYIQIH
ncbi:hypothetical protein [Aquimarina litoralis]|uniref:hypothetical protein n=1 Tax=Aquimarina litoralis TaxID=584605 RepID=UPI001C586342|nr:hypothetical protein [Aquimarina litoralis]MBW1296996.1 hypothetical protein [Aquimarina litoralis]